MLGLLEKEKCEESEVRFKFTLKRSAEVRRTAEFGDTYTVIITSLIHCYYKSID